MVGVVSWLSILVKMLGQKIDLGQERDQTPTGVERRTMTQPNGYVSYAAFDSFADLCGVMSETVMPIHSGAMKYYREVGLIR